MKNSTAMRVVLLIVVIAMVATLILPLFTYATDLDSLYATSDSLSDQIAAQQDIIEELEGEIDAQAELAAEIETLIAYYNEQIANVNAQITAMNAEIAEKEAEIEATLLEIETKIENFKDRVREDYMSTDSSVLSILSGAQTFSEFMISAEFSVKSAEYDNELITELYAAKDAIDASKAEIELQKADIVTAQEELVAIQADLEVQQASVAAIQAELEDDADAVSSLIEQYQAELAANQAEIAEVIANSGNTDYVGGEFIWPASGYISSYFGWRVISGVDDYHTGIDITGGSFYGTPVVASNAGVVSMVRYNTTGYGYYVMIDHGGGKQTLYAHNSSILVVEGQVVAQGETISLAGSTGWSTGPHLHFEIRINGSTVDPLTYLP